MAQTKIKAGLFEGIIGNGTDGYFLMSNGDGTMTWSSIVIDPTITSLAYPGSVTAADPAGGETITVTGTGFKTGATVTVGGTAAPAVSYVSGTQITFTTPAKTAGDYDIVVTNTDTGSATYINGISYNGIPSWTTAAGSLGTFASGETISTITLQATEPDAGTITFNITNGALPTGLSLTGADIDGTTTLETADTLYTFTVTATDDESQATPRTFTITVKKEFKSVDNFTINTYTGNGSTQSIEGKIGTAASFNGSSSKITSSNLGLTGNPVFSISFWVNPNSNAGTPIMFGTNSTGQAFVTYINPSNKLNFGRWGDSLGDTTASIANNTWTHVAISNNSGSVQVYINGTADLSFSTTYNINGDDFYIGAAKNSQYFDGKIDQVRIFNKAISSSEVTTLYGESNTSTTKSTTDIFDDGSGVALYEFEKGAIDTGGVNGYIGSAGVFNGSSSYILLNGINGTNFTPTAYSVSAWFKTTSNNEAIFSTDGGGSSLPLTTMTRIFVNSGGYIEYDPYTVSSRITSTVTVNDGNWHFVCVSTDSSGNTKLYVDNQSPVTGTGGGVNFRVQTFIGCTDNAVYSTITRSNFFEGQIDQVRIFNKALSSSEVTTLSNETSASATKSTTDIFDDGSGVALYELEGNANDTGSTYNGTPTNVTYGYDGTPTNVSFVGTSFQPDLVFTKSRSFTEKMNVFDSVRGATKRLYPTDTHTEATQTNSLTSFNSNGWSIGAWTDSNTNNETFVSYAFKGGGAAVSNTDGTITSTVSANQNAGFSIVKWTGTGAINTIGHGLSSAPELILIKPLDITADWQVYAEPIGNNNKLALNTTSASSSTTRFDSTSPTSTVFTFRDVGISGDEIAYCFTSITGYQRVGSYSGNSSVQAITTGFQPRWLMIKCITTSTGNWFIYDSIRDTSNPRENQLEFDTTAVETNHGAVYSVDFQTNGFELNGNGGEVNYSGRDYIYLAIA